jgi:hypothetical protein
MLLSFGQVGARALMPVYTVAVCRLTCGGKVGQLQAGVIAGALQHRLAESGLLIDIDSVKHTQSAVLYPKMG